MAKINKISSIDIGSNSIKQRIYKASSNNEQIKELTQHRKRIPLSLGKDVYRKNKNLIKKSTIKKLGKILKDFQEKIFNENITHSKACATAAFRHAANRHKVLCELKKYSNINIEVISGKEEIAYIGNIDLSPYELTENYLIVDVGGGSTEILVKQNSHTLDMESFSIGTISLSKKNVSRDVWEAMNKWLCQFNFEDTPILIGIGGGIRGLLGASNRRLESNNFYQLYENILFTSVNERMSKFIIPRDRARNIHHSAFIYQHILKLTGIKNIRAIPFGLSEGIAFSIIKNNKE